MKNIPLLILAGVVAVLALVIILPDFLPGSSLSILPARFLMPASAPTKVTTKSVMKKRKKPIPKKTSTVACGDGICDPSESPARCGGAVPPPMKPACTWCEKDCKGDPPPMAAPGALKP